MAHFMSARRGLHQWMLLLATFVLVVCLQQISTAEVDGDLVFDDVTSNPSSIWRKFSTKKHLNHGEDIAINKDIDEENNQFFSPIRLHRKLGEGFQRVKRGFFDIWSSFVDSETKAPEIEETEPVTDLSPAGNTLTTLSRETRSTQSDDPEIKLDVDDEDYADNSGISSGMTGESSLIDSDEITRGERIRATLLVKEPYEKEFKDVNSEKFKEISTKISEAIRNVYKDFPGQKDVYVVTITNTTDIFEISVIVDMDFADSYNSARIQRRLREAVSKNSLGDFTVSTDVTTRNFAAPPEPADACLPGEIKCVSKEHGRACLPSEARCNGIEECADGYDELNCHPSTPLSPEESSTQNSAAFHPRPSAKLCRSDDQVVCSGSSVTICGDQLCDGHEDCPDGFDEKSCNGCAAKEFSCDVSRCIPFTSLCDGRKDCADGLDERDCPEGSHVCPEGQFMCTSGHCISVMTRCDQKVDCPEDEADEEGCPCSSREWQCNDGSCIPISSKCDGHYDCPNGDDSDERNCPQYSNDCTYKCRNGHCIEEKLWCNGYVDCYDGSDEKYCPCHENDFKCNNGVCIRKQLHCDGMMHCNDGSDEVNCDNIRECRPTEFQCHSSNPQFPVCIDSSRRCNRVNDCDDGSDERNCTAQTACTAGTFRCNDNFCIHKTLVCNGAPDCYDGSDEYDCDDDELAPCPSSDFSCEDGYCIPLSQKCDGLSDCASGIDEIGCPNVPPTQDSTVPCLQDEFRCNNGDCINKYLLCDQINDCIDKSDETNCPSPEITSAPTCSPSDFTCFNGQCVRETARCNGVYDCMDQSDEHNCITQCSSNEFRCRNGRCIPSYYVCDRRNDCSDSSDEMNCTKECRPDEFQCSNGHCIPRYRYCDRSPDCIDGSDERNCPPSLPISCSWNQFACSSGDQCVPKSSLCDNKRNCNDGSDEFNCGNSVLDELNLKTYPDDQKIKESRDVVFQCRDEGPLRAQVRWSKGSGLPLPPGSSDINGRLEMHNIQLSDGGNYVCEAIGYPQSTPGARVSVILQVEPFQPLPTRPPQACALDEATCSNGDCIKKHMICNGRYDCTDGSDENRCNPLGCEPNQFRCDNKKCVQKTWLCDSDNDCGDWSDEQNCGTTPPGSRCKYNEFECAKVNQCIPKSFHCDMEVDCQDHSDEIGCSAVTQDLSVPLPPLMEVEQGEVFTAHCRMIGVPKPVVVWRKNWGHIPSKCVTTSDNGYGTITCPDVQDSDQGAYSCEGLNSRGSTFANPDIYLLLKKRPTPPGTCPAGQFNTLAARPEECISCFCFGATSDCSSANLFTFQFPPPADHHELLDVYFNSDGSVNINDHSTLQSSMRSNRQRNGFQLLSFPSETSGFYEHYYPYYMMPDNDEHGSYLKSYGGYLSYSVLFNGKGQPVDDKPDVIIKGNGYILVHRGSPMSPGREHKKKIRLFRGDWYKVKDPKSDQRGIGVLATREDIMMTLVNVENILIKAQYLSGPGIETTISDIHMDSAGISNVGLGQAAFVEECRCPIGYSGLSCEQCSPGFMRHSSGPWLGHCKRFPDTCQPGTYGDPSRNIPCEPCPCPLTNPSNQFGRTCYLDSDNQPTCNCPPGYRGRDCGQCDYGYSGNPLVPGDYCKRDSCDPDGSLSPVPDQGGQCRCREYTTGKNCDQCKANAFDLSSKHRTGCLECFCMGITRECTSLKWYRNQISSAFTTNTQGFELIEPNRPDEPIIIGLRVESGEMIFKNFPGPDVYYWVLPARFLGNRVSSYGGYLNYTIRYEPTPGGQSSRNNAPDVEFISTNGVRLRHYNNEIPVDPNRPVTISVPIMEHKWQRDDGQPATRENLMVALANLTGILVKATYTTNTLSASLITISLDTVDERNTNQARTSEVELCSCPYGYKGFSCEECDTGYTRIQNGLYLGACELCKCNGHSTQCDPVNGKCYNCRDHTEGDSCERCERGYRGNPIANGSCIRDEVSPECNCDERGSLSRDCRGNECFCKRNVEGSSCNQCRRGTFDLSAEHPEGCLECFCSSVSDDCQSANLYVTQIPKLIIDKTHGFTLTDSNRENKITDGFELTPQNNEIGYNVQNQQRSRLFWSLPEEFTGNKVTSYGGNLTFSQRYSILPKGKPSSDIDVQIVGNGISLFWRRDEELPPDQLVVQTIPLVPGDWRRLDRSQGQKVASREDIMTVLSRIEAIIIRAIHNTETTWTYLSDVSLDTAVPQYTGQKKATYIETCRCPVGYQGTSCESCSPGYYRDLENRCNKCPCNNNEESCSLGPGSRVVCYCKPSFTGTYCDSLATASSERPTDSPTGSPPTISISITEPTYRLALVGETVRMNCLGRSLLPERVVSLKWSKDGGELPRGRSDDNNRGLLTISNVRPSDSGVYICTASDSYSFVTEQATLYVNSTHRNIEPRVSVTPAYLRVREGEPVEFRCTATGTPSPVIQWSGQGGLNRQASFSSGLFYIRSAQKEDEGSYECTASNAAGSDSRRVNLKVESTNASTLLSVQPREYSGYEGETIELQCLPLSVDYTTHWNRSGQPLPPSSQDRDGVLTIYNAHPLDSGMYICFGVSLTNAPPVQTQARVSIESRRTPPKVMIEPESQTILQGMSGEIRCIATGDPPPSVTWNKQQERDYFPPNVQVSGNILRISSARVQDRGLYVCQAQNTAGTSRGAARVEVEPREPPQVEMYPKEYNTVIEGGSVMVQCRVTAGIPTPRLQWSRADGRPLPVGAELPGGALRLIKVSMEDKGRYLCNVSNDVGAVTAVASIDVQSLPVIRITPPGPVLNVRLGQSVRMECRASGYPPASVTWNTPPRYSYSINSPSLEGSRDSLRNMEVAVFEIDQVQARDEGIYVCKAQNAAGPAEEEIQLLISNDLDPGPTRGDVPSSLHPFTQGAEGKIELDETNFRLPTGAQAHIRCISRGNDNIYLKWVKDNGLPLPPQFMSIDGVLYLNNVQREDAGFYTCLGISPQGNSVLFTATASLKVIELPRITLDPERQFKKPGESAQIRCIAHGDQPINISWAAVNRNLPPSVTYDRGYLTFASIVPEDAGHYICRARNPYGDAEAVAEVIVNNRTNYTRPVVTAADRNPVATEGSDITLKCDSDPDSRLSLSWTRHQSSLPSRARVVGNALHISNLREEDSGRYICDAQTPSGIRSSDYINLYVTQRKCLPRQFRCNTGNCIPETAVCDGYPHCPDRSDERDCNYRPGRGANNVKLRIIPSKDVVAIGDNIELHCKVTGTPQTELYWTSLGDTPSANVQDDKDIVRITDVELSNRGLYKCKAPSATGYVEAEYILNVLDPPNTPNPTYQERDAEKRTASYGDMVVLDCDAQLLPPVVYSWTKEGGEILSNTNTRQGRLVIPSATSSDAGLYICSAESGDSRINIPTILTVTRAVPFFSQAPVSYIAVPTLRDANLEFEIEISFKPEQYDGLILYNSQSRDGSGDFVSFGMKNGLVEFRFDVGSGLAIIRNDRPLQLSQWHTVKLHRVRKEGRMYVDGNGPFTGLGSGAFVQLDLLEPLFLGGVPSFANVNKQAGLNSGFVGCISRLVIGKKEVDIIKETLTKEGVTDCETCAVNPCENNGVCQEAQTKQGYKCICPRGFRGENCSYIGDPCYEGACGSGKCVSSGSGIKCSCPLNKSGEKCERTISIVEPAFSGDAYLAYPTPKVNHKLKIALKINPSEVSDSLLLYSAQNDQGSGDFVSLSIKDRHVEFRHDSGQGPVILRSRHELKPGQWVTVSAVRDHKEDGRNIHSRLSVDKEPHISKSEPSRSHKSDLSLRTFVFVGGINKSNMKLSPEVGVEDGFHGCISEVEISGLDLDLLRSVMESSNVQECSDLHGDLCNLHPCQNNAVCRPTSQPPRYICDCQSGFSGIHCEHENNMCKLLTPCNNGAKCTGTSSSYYCDCPLGFSGPTCSDREEFSTEVNFRGNGYIELDKRLLPHTNPNEKEIVTIDFSTDKPNSILFWHGQSPDTDGREQDFLSLAVVNGYLEMSWELGNGVGTIRSSKRVDDGLKHSVQMMRTAQSGSFSVDNGMKVQGESPGSMTQLNTNGNIYIGGLPDIGRMTGRRYTDGLDGCIHLIQIQNSGVINLMDEAVSGLNVGRCSRSDLDDYSNDIDPAFHNHFHRGDLQIH